MECVVFKFDDRVGNINLFQAYTAVKRSRYDFAQIVRQMHIAQADTVFESLPLNSDNRIRHHNLGQIFVILKSSLGNRRY